MTLVIYIKSVIRNGRDSVVLRITALFEECRGQLVQYCTQNALIYPQMSDLVTTTTAVTITVMLCIVQTLSDDQH